MPDKNIANASTVFLFDGEGGASARRLHELTNWTSYHGVLWAHLNYTNEEDQKWLNEASGLNPLIVEALLAQDTRPRTTAIDDGLLIALRGINVASGENPEDMVAIRMWITHNRIVTTRNRNLVSVSNLIEELNSGQGPVGAAEFLVRLIDLIVWLMNDIVDQLEDKVSEFEEQILEPSSASLRYELASLRRQAISLRRYLVPEREALSHLATEKVSWLNELNRMQIKEVSDSLIRHLEDLDTVREHAAVSQEELISRLSEQLNSRMYIISIITSIFLPLSFFTSLLGINVAGIPGSTNDSAFWMVSGAMIVVFVIQILIFRWKKWL